MPYTFKNANQKRGENKKKKKTKPNSHAGSKQKQTVLILYQSGDMGTEKSQVTCENISLSHSLDAQTVRRTRATTDEP